ncbi:MAG: hypothetical protein M1834_008983 [Cirrosporium novae-zelandiae]|nr:MAG: hypothetical protein M1834_008983 [Cirrosporium novae-zelandiae]
MTALICSTECLTGWILGGPIIDGNLTCVGHKADKSRCRSKTGEKRHLKMSSCLEVLTLKVAQGCGLESTLSELASYGLCFQHQSQQEDTIDRWTRKLKALDKGTGETQLKKDDEERKMVIKLEEDNDHANLIVLSTVPSIVPSIVPTTNQEIIPRRALRNDRLLTLRESPQFNLPIQPPFTEYHTHALPIQTIHSKLKGFLLKPLSLRDEHPGYVYAFTRRTTPSHIKIGITERSVGQRLAQWEGKCNYSPYELFSKPTPNVYIAERLVATSLSLYRRRETVCNGGHGCFQHHREWYEVEESVARKWVTLWTTFLSLAVYNHHGLMNQEWREWVETFTLDDKSVVDESSLWRAWQQRMHTFLLVILLCTAVPDFISSSPSPSPQARNREVEDPATLERAVRVAA